MNEKFNPFKVHMSFIQLLIGQTQDGAPLSILRKDTGLLRALWNGQMVSLVGIPPFLPTGLLAAGIKLLKDCSFRWDGRAISVTTPLRGGTETDEARVDRLFRTIRVVKRGWDFDPKVPATWTTMEDALPMIKGIEEEIKEEDLEALRKEKAWFLKQHASYLFAVYKNCSEAIALYNQALLLDRKILGKEGDDEVVADLKQLALIHLAEDNLIEAIRCLEHAQRIKEQSVVGTYRDASGTVNLNGSRDSTETLKELARRRDFTKLAIPADLLSVPKGLDALLSMQQLEAVDLDYPFEFSHVDQKPFNDDTFLQILVKLENLAHLGICRVSPLSQESINTLKTFKKLKSLSLEICTNKTNISLLAQLPLLTSLDLRSTYVTDADLDRLKPLQQLSSLKICLDKVTKNGLLSIGNFKELRSLGLKDKSEPDNLEPIDRQTFENVLSRLPKLMSLTLNRIRLPKGTADLLIISTIESITLLQCIDVDDQFCDALSRSRISSLVIRCFYNGISDPLLPVTDKALQSIGKMGGLRSLCLCFDSQTIKMDGLNSLLLLPNHTSLDLQIRLFTSSLNGLNFDDFKKSADAIVEQLRARKECNKVDIFFI